MPSSARPPFLGLAAALVAMLLAACGDGTGASTRYVGSGTVAASVVLGSETDRSGAQLTLAGTTSAAATTDASGAYQFSRLAPGSYVVTASLPWTVERTVSAQATVAAGQTAQLALAFTPVGDVAGRVSLQGVSQPSGVVVAVAGTQLLATTDATGAYHLTGVRTGAQTLIASAPGFASATAQVNVTYRQTATAPALSLVPGPTPPVVTFGAASPNPAKDGDSLTLTYTADRAVDSCNASVAGVGATCAKPAGASCTCTLLVSPALPEGSDLVLASAVSGSASGTARALVSIQRTPPALDLSKLQILRKPVGQNDSVAGAAGAIPGMLATNPLDRPAKVNLRNAAGVLLASAVPAADGSLPETTLPASDGTGTHFAPGEVLASAVSLSGIEGAPASIPAGRDVAGPVGNGALIGFHRLDTTQPDGLLGQTGAFADAVSALVAVRLYLPDGTFVGSTPPQAGGGFAEVALGAPLVSTPWVASGAAAPARLLASAVDKCGNEGARVEAQVGAALAGPAVNGAAVSIARRGLGAQDGLDGAAGALSSTCWPTSVSVATSAALPVAGNLAGQGTGPVAANGSFPEVPVGTFTQSYPRLWVSAGDKCGLSSSVAVEALGADVTPPVVDPTLVVYALQSGSAATVRGLAGAAKDLLSAVREVDLLPPGGGAPLVPGFAPNPDGSFADQVVGAAAGDHVQVVAIDKPGNVAAAVLSRKVSATLSLASRTRQAPLAPLTGAVYAFAAPFDPRTGPPGPIARPMNPGLAPVLGAELSAADITKASVLDGVTTATPAAPPSGASGAGWTLASGGPRSYVAGAFDSQNQDLIVFGGYDGAQVLDETLEYVPLLGAWNRVAPVGGAKPPPRTQAAMVDLGNGSLLLFGGADATGIPLGDTWLWTGATFTWTQLTAAVAPGARFDASIAFDQLRGKVVLFGGRQLAGTAPYLSYAPLGDTWELDVASRVWTRAAAVAPSAPAPRASAAMTWVQRAPYRTVLFGGVDAAGAKNGDLWTWDGTAWTLSPAACPPAPATCPAARYGAALAFDPSAGYAVLQGGEPASVGNETWQLDPAAWAWKPGPTLPGGARSGHVLAPYNQSAPGVPGLLLVGGGVPDTLAPVSYTAGAWAASPGAPALPAPRSRAPFAFDANRGSLLVHGNGTDPSPAASDTWAFAGAWSLGAASAPALGGGALAWDGTRGVAVLYGCTPGAAPSCATWEWDGTAFQPKAPAHLPNARRGHALAWDAAHGAVVLFGGADANGNPLSETWTWDGADWTQLQTPAAPPARWYAGLAFDAGRGVTVLYGGLPGAGLAPLSDTWELSTAGWAQRAPGATPPPASAAPALAFDPLRQRTVLYGDAGTVWEWDGASWASALVRGPGARTGAALTWSPASSALALLGGSISPLGDFPAGSDLGDLWLLDRRAPSAVFAAQVATFAVDPQATLSTVKATYAGAARGDNLGAATYGVDLLAWDWVQQKWIPLGTSAGTETQTASNAMTLVPLPGTLANYVQRGRVALLAAPSYPSSAPGGVGIPSDLWTDYVGLQVEYLLP